MYSDCKPALYKIFQILGMQFLLLLLSCWFGLIAEAYIAIRDRSLDGPHGFVTLQYVHPVQQRSNTLQRRTPMKQIMKAMQGDKKKKETSPSTKPLLSRPSGERKPSTGDNAKGQMTIYSPQKPSFIGAPIRTIQGTQKVKETLWSERQKLLEARPGTSPPYDMPGIPSTYIVSDSRKASVKSDTRATPSSQVMQDMTARRVKVKLNTQSEAIGTTRFMQKNGQWSDAKILTEKDMPGDHWKMQKFIFEHPDGSPIRVESTMIGGGRLQTTGKNHGKPGSYVPPSL